MNLQASGPTAVAAAAILAAPMILSAQTAERTRLASEYGHVPLTFEANTGQTDPQVAFLARGAGYALFLTPGKPSSACAVAKSGRGQLFCA